MVATTPRHWSNIVWACRVLGVYDAAFLSAAASAILKQAEQATQHDVSETLIALARQGWYEPAFYDALTNALLRTASKAAPQHVCNVLYACGLAQHVTPTLQQLAGAALANRGLKQWVPQDISNTLLACAVFALHVRDSTQQAPVLRLSRILFEIASRLDPREGYNRSHLRQLERAHHAAQRVGLPSLAEDSRMFMAVKQEWERDLGELVARQPLPFQHAVNCAAAATGRYMVVPPSIRGGWVLVQQDVQHVQLGYHVAVLALGQESYLRHPLGQLTGPARLRLNNLADRIPVVVVVYEHEWEALSTDKGAQVAHLDQLLQQAEAALAAAGGSAREQGGVADIEAASSREPVIIGLLPQLYYHQQDQQQPEDEAVDTATPPPPPPPKLTPAEAQARLKELDQKQQTFFQGLPPVATLGKSPAQPQQHQPLGTTAQAPTLRPPRRPGA
jgi:hypothetical protein